MKKILIITVLFVFVVTCFSGTDAFAGNPAPLFNRPVKLDDSGRPLYNSWERQEYMRKQRAKRLQQKKKKQEQADVTSSSKKVATEEDAKKVTPNANEKTVSKDADDTSSVADSTISKEITVEPTPSSAVINRPMKN